MTSYDREYLWSLGLAGIKSLEVETGILASGREEIYGCIFGRDSLITALSLLRVYGKTRDRYFLDLVGKTLANLALLQGREMNIESGEEPGKMIHEFRPDRHEHLTLHATRPWYVYPDQTMKNYDSVDSTPLFLLAAHAYMRARLTDNPCRVSFDALLPHVKAALEWILVYGDSNGDGLVDYRLHEQRTYGGLATQSWMDSRDSVFHESGNPAVYPIAPVEVQGYAWLALRTWGDYFRLSDRSYAEELDRRAASLKRTFNERFVLSSKEFSLAFGIDGNGAPMVSPRSSMGHLLWAAYEDSAGIECVLEQRYVTPLVKRLMQDDLFATYAGIRTLSTRSALFNPLSYHNGSIWPHDSEIIAEGFERFGYREEAGRIRSALFTAYLHFKTPLEFFVFDGTSYSDCILPSGHRACKTQAWSAGALLSALAMI